MSEFYAPTSTGIQTFVEQPSLELTQNLWNLIGLALLATFAGVYGIWAWMLEIRRLPHFLDDWEGENHADNATLARRPPGIVSFPFIAGVLVLVAMHYPSRRYWVGISVLWPILLLVGIWSVRSTQRKPHQPVQSEHLWIIAAFILQIWLNWLMSDLPDLVRAVVWGGSSSRVIFQPVAIMVLILLIASYPIANEIVMDRKGHRYLFAGCLLVAGVLALAVRSVVPANYVAPVTLLSIIGIVNGLLMGAFEYAWPEE